MHTAATTETVAERSARIEAMYAAKRAAFATLETEMAQKVARLLPDLSAQRAKALAHNLALADDCWSKAHDYALANYWYDLAADLIAYSLAADAEAQAAASKREAA